MSRKLFSKHSCRKWTIWSASFLFGSFVGTASAQQNPTSEETQNPNPDVTQGEVASFDAFLDSHPAIDRELRSNPSLISNTTWVQNHPQLQAYLSDHPRVRGEILENPSYFIHREDRYEARERERGRNEDRDTDRGQNGNPDVTRGEVASFDQFLDRHPEIDRQLSANPSLANDAQYLQQHPELQAYLRDHQNVRAELSENPNGFMNRERHYDAREAQRQGQSTQNPNPDTDRDNRTGTQNPDVTRGQVASFDQFLDRHPEIDQQLTANPSLINSPQYLQQHPELQTWLNDHQNVKAELTENPNNFMNRERRYDTREARQNEQGGVNYDVTRSEIASFDQFLDRHADIDRQLSSNPSLINNQQYLQQHPGLQAYLADHPNVKEELTENPSYFMRREGRYDAMETRAQRQNQNTPSQSTGQNITGQANQGGGAMPRENRNGNPNPDLTQGEIASFDQFLDDHQDVNKQLEKNPQLVNEAGYVKKHKALATYLNEHPAVREELTENPAYFMKRENRFELSERDRDLDRSANNQPNNMRSDADRDRDVGTTTSGRISEKELKEADKFLSKHKKIDKDLRKNPSLSTNPEYLEKHKDFDVFLNKNPEVQEAMRRNPSEFMHERARVEHMNHKPKEPPAKSKAEKREETRPTVTH